MNNVPVDHGRRKFLTITTSVVGAVGVGALAIPFVSAWNPSEKAKAAGAPVSVDFSKMQPGQLIRIEWRGKPVWIVSRAQNTLDILKSISDKLRDPTSPDKLLGVVCFGGSIVILFFLPWLDRCKVKSIRYQSWIHKLNITQFIICFIILGVLGAVSVTPLLTLIARIASVGYFGFFIALWIYSKNEKTKPLPERLTR